MFAKAFYGARLAGGAIAMWLAAAVALGQTAGGGVLQGYVQDPGGLPIAGATTFVVCLEAGFTARARTDGEGNFLHSNLPAGSCRLEVSAPGFETARLAAQITSEVTCKVQVKLKLPVMHQGLVVAASRREQMSEEALTSASVVGHEMIQETLAISPVEALEALPGVTSVNAGPFRARPVVRGLDSNRVLVLVDGERLNNARTATTQAGIETSLVDVQEVERIEVIRGPGSVLYGSDALGGIVNIVTASPPRAESGFRFGGKLRTEYHSASTARRGFLALFGSTRRLSLRLSGSVGRFDNYDSPLGTVFGSELKEDSSAAELRAYPAQSQSLFLKYTRRGGRDYGLPSLDRNPAFLALFPFSTLNKVSFGHYGHFSSRLVSSLSTRFYFQNQDRDFFNMVTAPGFSLASETITRTDSFGFDAQATALPGDRQVLTYGVTFYRDRSEDERTQTIFPGTPMATVIDRSPSVPESALSGTGLFIQDQFAVTSRLSLMGGVRFDVFKLSAFPTPNYRSDVLDTLLGSRTDSALSGQLAAMYEVLPGVRLVASVGRAFREPNLFERFFFGRGSVGGFVVPNPGLEPETSLNVEGGVRVRKSRLGASLTYFRNRLSDLISSAPGTFNGQSTLSGQPVYQNVNIERALIQGVESEVEGHYSGFGSRWSPFIAASFQRGTNAATGQPLPLIAPAIGHVGLRWQRPQRRVWAEVRARVTRGTDRVAPGIEPLQGFAVFSLRGGWEIFHREDARFLPTGVKSVGLRCAIENIGNRAYRELFNNVVEPSRDYRLGLDFSF